MDSMNETGEQQATFPRRGTDYTPLPKGKHDGRVVSHAVQTIRATPEQVFNIYTRPELLPTWQEGVVSVTPTGANTLHWVMQDPGSEKQFEYDSEVLESVPSARHTSRVTSGPFESTTEMVTFEADPNGRGTIVTLVSDYKVPGGFITNALGSLFTRSPEQLTIENLRHLKQLMESREIPSVEGQPAGPRGIMGKWKQLLMGENIAPPPGTADRARPQDLPTEGSTTSSALLGMVLAVAGLAAWYGVRRLL